MKTTIIAWIVAASAPVIAAEKDAKDPKNKKEQVYSTTMDFDSSMIDGKMKAPSGFFLQGRNKQSLSNMVKLRSNFSGKLRDSEAAVKSLIK
jgi:hypothetical protein